MHTDDECTKLTLTPPFVALLYDLATRIDKNKALASILFCEAIAVKSGGAQHHPVFEKVQIFIDPHGRHRPLITVDSKCHIRERQKESYFACSRNFQLHRWF